MRELKPALPVEHNTPGVNHTGDQGPLSHSSNTPHNAREAHGLTIPPDSHTRDGHASAVASQPRTAYTVQEGQSSPKGAAAHSQAPPGSAYSPRPLQSQLSPPSPDRSNSRHGREANHTQRFTPYALPPPPLSSSHSRAEVHDKHTMQAHTMDLDPYSDDEHPIKLPPLHVLAPSIMLAPTAAPHTFGVCPPVHRRSLLRDASVQRGPGVFGSAATHPKIGSPAAPGPTRTTTCTLPPISSLDAPRAGAGSSDASTAVLRRLARDDSDHDDGGGKVGGSGIGSAGGRRRSRSVPLDGKSADIADAADA